jgi:hypothetical protein
VQAPLALCGHLLRCVGANSGAYAARPSSPLFGVTAKRARNSKVAHRSFKFFRQRA